MARLIRIDSELVRRGLARSRTHAATLIADGHVTLDGEVVTMVIGASRAARTWVR